MIDWGALAQVLGVFDTASGLTVFGLGSAVSLVAWRWLVSRDRSVDEDRAKRSEKTSTQIAGVSAKVGLLAGQVQNCATKGDLAGTNERLHALETEVKVNEARVIQRLDGLDKRLEGQSDVLGRIEDHLLRSKA